MIRRLTAPSSSLRHVRNRRARTVLARNSDTQLKETNAPQDPWERVDVTKDGEKTGQHYWWNKTTNMTTAVGAPRPEHWVEVKDKNNSGLSYYWNPKTNETTALGVPDPSLGLSQHAATPFGMRQQGPPQTLGSSMMTYMTLGFGMSMAFAFVGMIFR